METGSPGGAGGRQACGESPGHEGGSTTWNAAYVARAAMIKRHRLGGSNNRNLFSRGFWRLGSSRSRCWLIQFLVRAFFLTRRQPLQPHLDFSLSVWDDGEREQTCTFFGVSSDKDTYQKDTDPVGSGPHPL